MVGVASLVLWFIALALNPQPVLDCKGDCQEKYHSVCVARKPNCKCACVKDVAAGAGALRGLLNEYGVSSDTIEEAVGRYRGSVDETTEEFSFTVSDKGHTFTIQGQLFKQKDRNQRSQKARTNGIREKTNRK
jgi:hypothetical protein